MPISVLIADFDNLANEPIFTGSLEQALSIAIEGASFITTFPRSTAHAIVANRKPGSPLDVTAAQLVAASEGIKVVLAGSIAASGNGYNLSGRVLDSVSGNDLGKANETVTDKGGVLGAVQRVASTLRDALGDKTPDSVRQIEGETVTTISLEALKNYSIAQDLSSSGRQTEAIPYYEKAIQLDENFGRAYSGLATVLFNTGRSPEATTHWKKSLTLLNRMTDREKYRTLGLWFAGPGANYEQAIENFEKLVAQYPADRAGQNNLGFVYFQLLDFKKAMDHGSQAVTLYPKNPRSRQNYALYAMYAGDLKTAETEAGTVLEQSKAQYKAYLPLAAVAFSKSDSAAMADVYERMRGSGAAGASLAALGLADLAMYEGRWSDAEKLLDAGIAADEKSNEQLARATKMTALAEVYLAQNRAPQAVRKAQDAMAITHEDACPRVRGVRPHPRQPARRGAGDRRGVRPPVPAPQARLRRHHRGRAGASRRPFRSKRRTPSIARASWPTCGSAGF